MMTRILSILILSATFWSCSEQCDQDFFNFRLFPQYSITSECVLLGDELTFTLDYTDTLTSFFDTITYDLRDYNIVTSLSIRSLDDSLAKLENQTVAFDDFNISIKTGAEAESSFDPGDYMSFLPQRGNGSSLEVALEPKKKGVYILSFIHGNAGVFADEIVSDGCDDLILANYVNDGVINEPLLFAFDSTLVTQEELDNLIKTRAIFFFEVVEDTNSSCL